MTPLLALNNSEESPQKYESAAPKVHGSEPLVDHEIGPMRMKVSMAFG